MATLPTLILSNGCHLPVLGLGTFDNLKDDRVGNAVKAAIDVGYRMLDCAWIYRSESSVGNAIVDKIQARAVTREDLFISTKLWNTFHEPERVRVGVQESLRDLQLNYVDLLLMHWPMAFAEKESERKAWIMNTEIQPAAIDFLDTWRAMEDLVDEGLVRMLGVSNFNMAQLSRILDMPSLRYKPVNMQIESHPLFLNEELIQFCKGHGISVTAFSPLAKGGATYAGRSTENIMANPSIIQIAEKHRKSPAQVVLRWSVQRGLAIVPKSCTPSRIEENAQIFDFMLEDSEMALISSLNQNRRLVTLENYKDFPEYPF